LLILDTNVISEMMRDLPDQAVIDWLDSRDRKDVWTTAITIMELHHGIQTLNPSRRRTALGEALDRVSTEKIEDRIAAFDGAAAKVAAVVAAERRRAGRAAELRDTMIAGIALATGALLATRNTRHFDDLAIILINPWTA
jgi:predicted nucleic acid-binding protein